MSRGEAEVKPHPRKSVRVGVTGHIYLTPETARRVAGMLREYLIAMIEHAGIQPNAVTGVSCLAPGADLLFADAVLALGGVLEVILPSADYREAVHGPEGLGAFDELLHRASVVSATRRPTAGPEAYAAANEAMLETIDYLFAVWDGLPCANIGGTSHVVEIACARNIPVSVIWPPGARRRAHSA